MGIIWFSVIYLLSIILFRQRQLGKVLYCNTSVYYGIFELQQIQQFWNIRERLFEESRRQSIDYKEEFDKVELIPEFDHYYPAQRIIDSLQSPKEYQKEVDSVESGDQIVVRRHWRLAGTACAGLEDGNILGINYHICMEFVTLSQYKHTVHHTVTKPTEAYSFPTQCLSRYFIITERENGKLTHGGSTFRIEITTHDDVSTKILICTVQDLFNGIYIGYCPNAGKCLHVKILLRHTNFVAYAHPAGSYPVKPLNKIIHEDTHCDLYFHKAFDFSSWTWYKDSNKWSWNSERGKALEYSNIQIKDCLLSKAGSVLAIGDSHLRYALDNIFITHPQFNPYLPRDHKDIKYGNLRYIWTTFAENTASVLRGILKSNSRPPDTLVIWTGTWDLMGNRYYENFLNTTGRILAKRMREVAKTQTWKKVRKLWINNSAFPSQLPSKNNNFVRTAANAWLRKQLRGTGFEEIDSFEISSPREEQFVCLSHYSCRLHNTTYMYGQVGTMISNALLNKLC